MDDDIAIQVMVSKFFDAGPILLEASYPFVEPTDVPQGYNHVGPEKPEDPVEGR
jgi:hypothetical protein